MGTQIILNLPEELYRRAIRIAQINHQDVPTLLVEALEESPVLDKPLPEEGDQGTGNDVVDREMTAYLALHPTLWEKYPGHYVAIYEGELIDHDPVDIALSHRINEKYPDTFVWMSKVEEQPFRTLNIPSFRLEK